MKHLKKFESKIDEPKVGDYVMCLDLSADSFFNEYIKDKIGQIVDIQKNINNDRKSHRPREKVIQELHRPWGNLPSQRPHGR